MNTTPSRARRRAPESAWTRASVGALCLLAAALVGCSAEPGRTEGWAVGLRTDNPATSLRARYEVHRDGRLLFAGGIDAGVGGGEALSTAADDAIRPTATIRLTDAEIDSLLRLLAEQPTPPGPQTVPPVAGQTNFKGRIDSPSGSARFVSGPTPFLLRLEAMLKGFRAERVQAP